MAKNTSTIPFKIHAPKVNNLIIKLFDHKTLNCTASHQLKKTGSYFEGNIEIKDPNLLYKLQIDNNIFYDPGSKALKIALDFQKKSDLYSQFTFDFIPNFTEAKPKITPKNLVIYEMHLRGFTKSLTSGVKNKGSFLGVIEKIQHLKELGVNAVQIMPVMSFDSTEHPLYKSHSLLNYWGYNSLSFFSLMASFASTDDRLAALKEFCQMVEALHRQGIAVILDVVYNHVSTQCRLDLLDKEGYFILHSNEHTNYTGCGNTINANSSAAKKLILDSLKYFAKELNVDGFRFDLASCLTRGPDGSALKEPPLIREIEQDPDLKDCILIAEPWDPGGLYQVGTFAGKNFLQHNGLFRDTLRKSILCGHMQDNLKDQLQGAFTNTINFVTCHDGFTLADLVSYNTKNNEANFEQNRDGSEANFSNNTGIEGHTDNLKILKLREKKALILMTLTILSNGATMLRMADEYLHSSNGNNNTYCHDTPLNYFNWNKLKENKSFFASIRKLIRLKKEGPFKVVVCNDKKIELQGIKHSIAIDLTNYNLSILEL